MAPGSSGERGQELKQQRAEELGLQRLGEARIEVAGHEGRHSDARTRTMIAKAMFAPGMTVQALPAVSIGYLTKPGTLSKLLGRCTGTRTQEDPCRRCKVLQLQNPQRAVIGLDSIACGCPAQAYNESTAFR